MKRKTAREIALQLGFSVVMTEDFAENVLDEFFEGEHYASLAEESPLFAEFPDEKQMAYIRTLVQLIYTHRLELDAYIAKYSRGWKVGRISKTASAIMRCAMCEILYMDDVPNAAAINEAVELAKGYEDAEVVSFINGVLGSFMRGEIDKTEPPAGELPETGETATEAGADIPETGEKNPEPGEDAADAAPEAGEKTED